MKEALSKIRCLILDVDGTMTDGGVYLDSEGTEMKKFSIRDGAGILLLREAGVLPVILTGRKSLCVTLRARELGIRQVYQGVKDKKEFLERFQKEQNLSRQETAYLGDDLNDLAAMSLAGISACPSDAATGVLSRCSLVLKARGGEGAVREFTELVLSAKGVLWDCARRLWNV